jgi:NAD(P)-dependent dehydrogenase (short-subunit alcohol dehydrogenase family)
VTGALDFSGKVVIVTGGTHGIGRAIASRFLEHSAEVIVCARSAPAEPLEVGGRTAEYLPANVRTVEDIERVVARTLEQYLRIDVLVNNAGGSPPAQAADCSPRFLASIIELNLTAPLLFAQKANAVMQQQPEGGSIVNIASVSGLRPSPGTAAYGAAKAGLLSLTQSLAVEWAPRVRVNAIAAGLIGTERAELHYGGEAGIRAAAGTVPLGRLGSPRDVADACLYLASPLASYVTGSSLLLHGGGEWPAFLGAVASARKTGGERA